jgi:hypothetical protein
MPAHLNYCVAQQQIDDRLRVAEARRSASREPTQTHEDQRELVQSSLLRSQRQDRPTHRRWAWPR